MDSSWCHLGEFVSSIGDLTLRVIKRNIGAAPPLGFQGFSCKASDWPLVIFMHYEQKELTLRGCHGNIKKNDDSVRSADADTEIVYILIDTR